ncbi:hypothetical protein KJ782_07160, partial [Patescibacteria group bacterium]|nr:hypothetical protein [Patescibacteria group bacterium]
RAEDAHGATGHASWDTRHTECERELPVQSRPQILDLHGVERCYTDARCEVVPRGLGDPALLALEAVEVFFRAEL